MSGYMGLYSEREVRGMRKTTEEQDDVQREAEKAMLIKAGGLAPNHDGVGCVRGKTVNELLEEPLWMHGELKRYSRAFQDYITYCVHPGTSAQQVDEIREAFRCGWEYAKDPAYTGEETMRKYASAADIETFLAQRSIERLKRDSKDLINGYQTGKGWRS